MTNDEYTRCLALIDGYWPHGTKTWTADIFEIWESLLLDLDARGVAAAIQTLAVDGREFPPPPGLVRRRTLELIDPLPDADQAWHQVRTQMSKVGTNGKPVFAHQIIADVVSAFGWRDLCQSTTQMADRAHFLKLWERAVERQRTVAQMPPGARHVLAELTGEIDLRLDRPA